MTCRTDPLASPKCQSNSWVVSEAPVFVEESLGFEFLRIWEQFWIMQDCPKSLCKDDRLDPCR
jgi:hypothetical protein